MLLLFLLLIIKEFGRVKYHWNDEEDTIVKGDSKVDVLINDISIPSRNKYSLCRSN